MSFNTTKRVSLFRQPVITRDNNKSSCKFRFLFYSLHKRSFFFLSCPANECKFRCSCLDKILIKLSVQLRHNLQSHFTRQLCCLCKSGRRLILSKRQLMISTKTNYLSFNTKTKPLSSKSLRRMVRKTPTAEECRRENGVGL